MKTVKDFRRRTDKPIQSDQEVYTLKTLPAKQADGSTGYLVFEILQPTMNRFLSDLVLIVPIVDRSWLNGWFCVSLPRGETQLRSLTFARQHCVGPVACLRDGLGLAPKENGVYVLDEADAVDLTMLFGAKT